MNEEYRRVGAALITVRLIYRQGDAIGVNETGEWKWFGHPHKVIFAVLICNSAVHAFCYFLFALLQIAFRGNP